MFFATAPKGTYCKALRESTAGVTLDGVVLSKSVGYGEESVVGDPLGTFASPMSDHVIGGRLTREGFYGFQLPKNSKGYASIWIHTSDLIIV